jgi:type II secretion system protein I
MRRGFTLLEIVLALAILAGALAALGEVMRLSDQAAERTGDETQAQILADSVMAELDSGHLPFSAVDAAQFDVAADPPWTYSIALQPTQYDELVLVRVAVQQQLPTEKEPVRFELVRWTLNPDFVSAAVEESSTTTSSSGTSTSGTSTSTSSGSSTSAGGQ